MWSNILCDVIFMMLLALMTSSSCIGDIILLSSYCVLLEFLHADVVKLDDVILMLSTVVVVCVVLKTLTANTWGAVCTRLGCKSYRHQWGQKTSLTQTCQTNCRTEKKYKFGTRALSLHQNKTALLWFRWRTVMTWCVCTPVTISEISEEKTS